MTHIRPEPVNVTAIIRFAVNFIFFGEFRDRPAGRQRTRQVDLTI